MQQVEKLPISLTSIPIRMHINTSRALDQQLTIQPTMHRSISSARLDNNYMDLNVADVKFQGEIKWKALPELELSALGAVRYQASSRNTISKNPTRIRQPLIAQEWTTLPFVTKTTYCIPIRIIRMLCLSVYYYGRRYLPA